MWRSTTGTCWCCSPWPPLQFVVGIHAGQAHPAAVTKRCPATGQVVAPCDDRAASHPAGSDVRRRCYKGAHGPTFAHPPDRDRRRRWPSWRWWGSASCGQPTRRRCRRSTARPAAGVHGQGAVGAGHDLWRRARPSRIWGSRRFPPSLGGEGGADRHGERDPTVPRVALHRRRPHRPRHCRSPSAIWSSTATEAWWWDSARHGPIAAALRAICARGRRRRRGDRCARGARRRAGRGDGRRAPVPSRQRGARSKPSPRTPPCRSRAPARSPAGPSTDLVLTPRRPTGRWSARSCCRDRCRDPAAAAASRSCPARRGARRCRRGSPACPSTRSTRSVFAFSPPAGRRGDRRPR